MSEGSSAAYENRYARTHALVAYCTKAHTMFHNVTCTQTQTHACILKLKYPYIFDNDIRVSYFRLVSVTELRITKSMTESIRVTVHDQKVGWEQVRTHTYLHKHTHTHTFTYIYTYTYTYTYTYIVPERS